MINSLKSVWQDKKHKKIIIVSTSIMIVLCVFAVKLLINAKKAEIAFYNQSTDDNFVASNFDSDGDGIPDWEELLLGFNPYLADSDNDGIEDGRLVNTIREISQIEAGQQFEPTPFEDLTKTDQILRQTYAVATVLESTGNFTEEEKARLVETIQKDMLVVDEYRMFREDQIRIALSDTQSTKLNYMLAVSKEIVKIDVIENNPAMFLLASIEQNNPKIVEDGLDPVINNMVSVRNNLLALRVPVQFVNYHLTLVNTLQRTIQDTEQISRFYDDPLIGYSSVMKLSASTTDLYDGMSNMIAYIEQEMANANQL